MLTAGLPSQHEKKTAADTYGENVGAALSIVLMVTGLDYHLCRLKYLRDLAKYRKPFPYTPCFTWGIDDVLPKKLEGLLIQRMKGRCLRNCLS